MSECRPAPTGVAGVATPDESCWHEQLLRVLPQAIAETIEGQLEVGPAIERLSAAVRPLLPHDRLDIGWLMEDGEAFHSFQAVSALPVNDQPGAPDLVADSCLASVLRTGESLVFADLIADGSRQQAQKREHRLANELGLPACLAVPLRLGQRIIGFFALQHREAAAYTAADLPAAQLMAAQIGPIAQAMHLYGQEQSARQQLATVMAIGRAVSASLDLHEILQVIAQSLAATLASPACTIFLYDEDRQLLVRHVEHLASNVGAPGEARNVEAPGRTIPIGEPAGAAIYALRDPVIVANEGVHGGVLFGGEHGVQPDSILQVPFITHDRLVGLAMLPLVGEHRAPAERQLALAMGIAQSAAIAVERVHLYQQAHELGRSEERNRLAREVHDTLAQGLTVIILQLEAAERLLPPGAEARRSLTETRALARRSLDDARRAVWDLTPSALEGRSLREALEHEVTVVGQRTGLVATFQTRGDEDPVSEEQATALLRVTQEALHNIEKHAEAGRISVRLEFRRPIADATGQLALVIADDGRGFEVDQLPAERPRGFGLTSMRERVRLVGGELDVESEPGWGTRVRVRLPLASGPAATDEEDTANEAEIVAIRVLLVDDHPLAREGIRRLLADRPEVVVVGEAADGIEAVERTLALRPDVVLMDLQMPRLSGVGAVRELREAWPDARVLVLTTFAQDEHLFEALRAGARGYLLKDAEPDALIEAIRTVHDGGSLVQPTMATRLIDRFGQLASHEQLPDHLTERELEVLRLAATGARNKQIADQLVVSEKTVKHHLGQVYAKLGASGRTAAVARGRELGLLPLDALPS